jgi:hypothetical protein
MLDTWYLCCFILRVGEYANLQSYSLFQIVRLHYNHDNTNNELTHEMSSVRGNPTGIYKAIRNKSLNMDLRHK